MGQRRLNGERLRSARLARGWTEKQTGAAFGRSEALVSLVECDALGVPVDFVFTEDGDEVPAS